MQVSGEAFRARSCPGSRGCRGVLRLFRASLVFFPGGDPAADVAFGLVAVEDLLDLYIQRAVALRQPLRQVLVYGGFAQAEVLGGGADRRFVLYDVKSQVFGPVFQIVFDNTPLPCCYWPIYMAGAGEL